MNCKRLFFLSLFTLLAGGFSPLFAQTGDCRFTLIMNDTDGDGWNGGVLTIKSGPLSTLFNLPFGATDTVEFEVYDNQVFQITWQAGQYVTEVGYKILDNGGGVVSEVVAPNMPGSGVIFSGTGHCITCAPPLNFQVDDVWDTYARLKWSANPASPNPAVSWKVIYGPKGFNVAAGEGDTATTSLKKVTITGLQKKTWYDAYILSDCGAAGFATLSGPVSFETYRTIDLGITGVASPVSSCSLGAADTVRLFLHNYGAAPQTLIPMRYIVNGEEVAIPIPDDGMYTGVLGKDSTEVFEFETVFDFSSPGEYEIIAYTFADDDEDTSNDTFRTFINNRLFSPYQQPFEKWNGGYEVVSTAGEPSLVYGTPDKTNIPGPAGGQFAWVTGLTGHYNSDERTYLVSPCFDFTQLSVDPAISFSLARDIESEYDGAWLEVSIDGGNHWDKVGNIGEGLNWYNENIVDGANAGQAWSGRSNGWVTARHLLDGAAGHSEVHFRFAFASDISLQYDGLGIDDIRIFPAFNRDLYGVEAAVASNGEICGFDDDQVTFTFVNIGAQVQNGVQAYYSVNGGAPVIENVPGSVDPDESVTYTFNTRFDSRDRLSVVKCWTRIPGEFAPANDTATIVIDHRPVPTPFQENFEGQVLPKGWVADGEVNNEHGNVSWALGVNLYSFKPVANFDLPRCGPIGASDSLAFTYRVVDFADEAEMPLAAGTKFEVLVSTDCGQNFEVLHTIDPSNHIVTADMIPVRLGLAAYAGQAVNIRIKGTWSAGDFWFDVDNFNLLSCAADMALSADITNAAPGQNNGSATVQVGLGNPPFVYHWSNGSQEQTISNLSPGTYTVTVNDAYGCSDSFEFHIGVSATEEVEGLASFVIRPNPTSGNAVCNIAFDRQVDRLELAVFNLLGQAVWTAGGQHTNALQQEIDLSEAPAGMYLVRLVADGQVTTRRLCKQ